MRKLAKWDRLDMMMMAAWTGKMKYSPAFGTSRSIHLSNRTSMSERSFSFANY